MPRTNDRPSASMPTRLSFRSSRFIVTGVASVLALAAGLGGAQTPSGPGAEATESAPADVRTRNLSADLMYRLLVGDIALQRGEPALGRARLLRGGTRESRAGFGQTRDRSLSRRASARAGDGLGAALERTRSDGGASAAGHRSADKRRHGPGCRRLRKRRRAQGRARARAGASGLQRRGRRRRVSAAEPLARSRTGQVGDVAPDPDLGATVPERRRGAVCDRAGGIEHRSRGRQPLRRSRSRRSIARWS